MLETIRSQIPNIKLFKKFFNHKLLLKQSVSLPYDYYLNNEKSSFPLSFNLIITSYCNLSCHFCYYGTKLNKVSDELSTEEWKSFIDSIAAKKPSIFITGGEPFMRKDLFEIIEHIHKKNLHFGVVTNGILLNKKKIDKLIDLKIDNIFFSLHGLQETHDKITGNKNSFDILINNIKYFCDNKEDTTTVINCVADETNVHEIDKLIKLCEGLKIDLFRIQHTSFLYPGEFNNQLKFFKEHFPESRVSILNYPVNDYKNISKELIKIKNTHYNIPVSFKPLLSESQLGSWYTKNHDINRPCFSVWRSTHIQPNGDVNPCQYYNFVLGNIRETSFEKIWNSRNYRKLRKLLKKRLMPACKRCCKL